MHTKPRLVLLDSDVVITLHEIGVWANILSRYEVWMTETMVKHEVLYYRDSSGEKISIDLMEHISCKNLYMHSVSAEQIARVLEYFDSEMCSCLHSGEIEALAVMDIKRKKEGLFFCTGDAKAVEALVLMGLREKGVSLEQLLSGAGLTKKIPLHFSEKRFRQLIDKASANRIQGLGLQ